MTAANEAWLAAVKDVLDIGKPVAPQKSTGAGGRLSFEILAHTMVFDMRYPIVTIKPKTSWLYMAAEPMWVIDGSNSLTWSHEIERIQTPYSDNQTSLNGAYGPPFVQQLIYVAQKLNEDLNSRQAVMTIWKRNPFPSKDIPCTVALQFLVREGHIHTVVTMRSSDVGMGLPYDMLTFTCMTAEVAAMLKEPVEFGDCYIIAGSRHIYTDQFDKLNYLANETEVPEDEYKPWAMWAWPGIKRTMREIAAFGPEHRAEMQEEAKRRLLGIMPE